MFVDFVPQSLTPTPLGKVFFCLFFFGCGVLSVRVFWGILGVFWGILGVSWKDPE
jgi:hypothetical protein